MIEIEFTNPNGFEGIDEARISSAVRQVFADAGIVAANISIAVIDDDTIHQLNRRYLQHDYRTDVLSFPLVQGPDYLEGEIVVSADTATRNAHRFGWKPSDEIVLYVVHGALHLVRDDDSTLQDRQRMREAERCVLESYQLTPRYTE